jgi:hypothetical protein
MIRTLILTLGILVATGAQAHEQCREVFQPMGGGYYDAHGWVPTRWVLTRDCRSYSLTRSHDIYRPAPPPRHTHYSPQRPYRPTVRVIFNPRPRSRPHSHSHRR